MSETIKRRPSRNAFVLHTLSVREPGFGKSWKMTPEQIFRLNTVTAAPHNHRYERRVDAHKWANARTGLPLETNLATVNLFTRIQKRQNKLHGLADGRLPLAQPVTFDGTLLNHCWQDLSLGGPHCEAVLTSSRPIDLDSPWRNAPLPPAPPEDFDVMFPHGPPCAQIPSNFDSDSDDKPFGVFAPLPHTLPATDWHTHLSSPPSLYICNRKGDPHSRRPWPTFVTGFDCHSLNRNQLAHYTDNVNAEKIKEGLTEWQHLGFHRTILPFYPSGKAENLTPFPVAWLIQNDIEGNYTGMNHVLKKFPEATSFHRFVVSEAYSQTIREHLLTRSWVDHHRGNEYKKYPFPISVEHLSETVIYPIYGHQYSHDQPNVNIESLTVIPPNIVQVQFEE